MYYILKNDKVLLSQSFINHNAILKMEILFYRRATIPIVLHSTSRTDRSLQKDYFANTNFRPGMI